MKGLNVLIANNHHRYVEAFKFVLKNIDKETSINKIFVALTKKECLERIQKEKIDLVYIDADASERDGLELTKRIFELNCLIKVVAVPLRIKGSLYKLVQSGAVDCIKKDHLNTDILLNKMNIN